VNTIYDLFFKDLNVKEPSQVTKKNHYISQFLIKRFVGSDGWFYYYKKDIVRNKLTRILKKTTESTFYKWKGYPNKTEVVLGKIESRICEHIQKNPLCFRDKEFAVCLILHYYFRHPDTRTWAKNMIDRNWDECIDSSIRKLGAEQCREYINSYKAVVKDSFVESFTTGEHREIYNLLMKNYTLIKVKDDCDKSFFLGDFPMIFWSPGKGYNYRKYPLLESMTEFYFPISSNECFILLPLVPDNFTVSKKQVLPIINRLLVRHGHFDFISPYKLSKKYFIGVGLEIKE
jgi:hypothetical protein